MSQEEGKMQDEQVTIEDAEEAYEAGHVEGALDICVQLLEADPDDADALYLAGEAMIELQEFEAAEEIFADLLRLEPESAGAFNGRGVALFELCRFDEARAALTQATELDPRLAESRLYLGYFHERRGESELAAACFQRAVELDPEAFHAPAELGIEQLERARATALAALPPAVGRYLDAVEWRIEELPETTFLTRTWPPLSPLVLCLFEGELRSAEQTPMPLAHTPSAVVVFRGNFAKVVREPGDLERAFVDSLVVELEHFLDLDRAEAEALGLLDVPIGPDAGPVVAPGGGDRVLH